MDKLKIIKKAKGIVRINKVGMSPLVIKEKESVWPVSALGPYNKELLMFQKMGIIDLVSVEEKVEEEDKKESTKEGIEEGKEEASQELEAEVSEVKEEQSESKESENRTEENKKLSRRKKKVN